MRIFFFVRFLLRETIILEKYALFVYTWHWSSVNGSRTFYFNRNCCWMTLLSSRQKKRFLFMSYVQNIALSILTHIFVLHQRNERYGFAIWFITECKRVIFAWKRKKTFKCFFSSISIVWNFAWSIWLFCSDFFWWFSTKKIVMTPLLIAFFSGNLPGISRIVLRSFQTISQKPGNDFITRRFISSPE